MVRMDARSTWKRKFTTIGTDFWPEFAFFRSYFVRFRLRTVGPAQEPPDKTRSLLAPPHQRIFRKTWFSVWTAAEVATRRATETVALIKGCRFEIEFSDWPLKDDNARSENVNEKFPELKFCKTSDSDLRRQLQRMTGREKAGQLESV